MTKQQILDELLRTTKENGGIPLGWDRLEAETLIRQRDWRKYWVRLSDAYEELGLKSQEFAKRKYSDADLLDALAEFVSNKHSFPTRSEWDFNRTEAHWKLYRNRFGIRAQLINSLIKHCQETGRFADVISICSAISTDKDAQIMSADAETFAHVYLLKSGSFYKIGRTNALGRRGTELKVELPEESKIVHSITTDDPAGIEAYWHKRFAPKRKNGEWFELSTEDVRVFRKRKFM